MSDVAKLKKNSNLKYPNPVLSNLIQLKISFSGDGDIAWFYCLLDDFGEWDGQKIGWENVRWTGVLEKVNGIWIFRQMHFSSGRYKEAREYYAEFLKIRPHETFIQFRLKSVEKNINESAAYKIEQTILSEGLKNGREVYQQLKNDSQTQKYFNENEFIQMGYRFLNTDKISEAIEIFKMSVELFPDSFNTWDSLGEVYMKRGDKSGAIKNYEKSLELNPDNDNAKRMLGLLRKK